MLAQFARTQAELVGASAEMWAGVAAQYDSSGAAPTGGQGAQQAESTTASGAVAGSGSTAQGDAAAPASVASPSQP